MDHSGGCHCGNIHVLLRLSKPPEDNPIRTCTCSFCRSHNPRMISDPAGLLEVSADDWSLIELYRFGTRTADFLICRHCGVFVAAISDLETAPCAVVNVNCLDDRARFTAVAAMHEFQNETLETRTSRRAARPVSVQLAVLRRSTREWAQRADSGQYTAHLKERAMRWRRAKAECRIHGEGGDGYRFLAPSNGA